MIEIKLPGLVGQPFGFVPRRRDVVSVAYRQRLGGRLSAVVFAGELYRVLRWTPSLAAAAHIAAEHVSVAEDLCPSIKNDLLVLPRGG